jgi:hypothetical protein
VDVVNAHPSPREIQQGLVRLVELGRVAHTRDDGTRHRNCGICTVFETVPPAAMHAWLVSIDASDEPQ